MEEEKEYFEEVGKEMSQEELKDLVHKMLEETANSEELSDEEKEEIFTFLNKDYTIREAIRMKRENDVLTKQSFEYCNGTLKSVSFHRRDVLRVLNYAKFKLSMIKFMASVINMDVTDTIDCSVEKVKNTNIIIKNEKELLHEIKSSLKELEKYQVTMCNYDISVLLVLLYNLNDRLLLDVEDYVKERSYAFSGIDYIGNKNYDKDIELITDKIDELKLKLGYQNK